MIGLEDARLRVALLDAPAREIIPPLSAAAAEFKKALDEVRAADDRLRAVLMTGGWLE